MRKFSIIIPVYNRPDEIDELLDSLTRQTYQNFEVIVVEDGSTIPCKEVIEKYLQRLDLAYFEKKNEGQGFARNYGYERAEGDYFIVFDSDCLIPPDYLEEVNRSLNLNYLDAYGGPDRAHPSFTPVQKAISHSMTSFLTTGGTRGNKKGIGPFHPRSFNMGISPEVFKKTGGYIMPFKGEDIEFSIRINKTGFKTGLIPGAYVYHKRRTSWLKFYKQLHFFGTARINIARYYPDQLKPVHFFPMLFTLGLLLLVLTYPFSRFIFYVLLSLYLLFSLLLFGEAYLQQKRLKIAVMSVWAGFIQLTAYGTGFMQEGIKRILKG
ncbi:MAG: glycosyltransferase [Cyclobacteriaceae bacterium]|nr:glycosyltransferase [Cyclobacteriaceae bacterium]